MLLLLQAWAVVTVVLLVLLGAVVGAQALVGWTRRRLASAASPRHALQVRRT